MKKDLVNSLSMSNFEGYEICTYIFEGRICYVALEIAKLLQYGNPSKAVYRCIEGSVFKEGEEYEVLKGERLKLFKSISFNYRGESFTRVNRIVIFYEKALNRFLSYSGKELASIYKAWFKNNIEEIHKSFNLEEEKQTIGVQENINLRSLEQEDKKFDKLNEVLGMIKNLYILDSNSKKVDESIDNLIVIAKYLIDKLQ
ncbi:MAG: hypothetical protein ACRCWM_03930 [Sarcina sp.]